MCVAYHLDLMINRKAFKVIPEDQKLLIMVSGILTL